MYKRQDEGHVAVEHAELLEQQVVRDEQHLAGDHHEQQLSLIHIYEKLMTHGTQYAETEFKVELDGEGCSTDVVSRSVARDESKQL